MWKPLTCDSFGNVTFSQESEAGPMPPDLLESPTMSRYGPEAALASRSALAGQSLDLLTLATCGPSGSASSASAALQSSMANRLRELMEGAGSTWFGHSWKVKATPSRRLIWQLAASAHRIPGSGSILWRTPTATDNRDRGNVSQPSIQRRMRLGKQIGLSMLFLKKPCPFCVAAMMGYPQEWTRCADMATPSSRS